jgi:hypothetical protein
MSTIPDDHPMLAAIARAPEGEPLTPEQEAELDQQWADLQAGRGSRTDLPQGM